MQKTILPVVALAGWAAAGGVQAEPITLTEEQADAVVAGDFRFGFGPDWGSAIGRAGAVDSCGNAGSCSYAYAYAYAFAYNDASASAYAVTACSNGACASAYSSSDSSGASGTYVSPR
jgi:hypothetical protein